MTDPLSDMFTRIRNAQAVRAETALIPYSKLKMEIAKTLKRAGFIKEANKSVKRNKKFIDISLLYSKEGSPRLSGIQRISKPSRRIYYSVNEITSVKQGLGAMILSTSRGILIDKEARKKKTGGEAICKIW
jgi:small subunit ribosomal protein S8